MEILIVFVLILVNGFLSMSEMAVVSARKSKLETDAKKGSKKAKAALELADNPDDFFSTLQIGITLIGILTGLFSGEAFAADLSIYIAKISFLESYAFVISKAIIVIFVTYLTLVIGELVPKRLGLAKAESISKFIAKPMMILSKITYPLVWVLAKSTSFISNLLGLNNTKDSPVTEAEIKAMMKESLDDGELDEAEHDMVERVFDLGDRKISSIMTHRSELVTLDIKDSKEILRNKVEKHLYNNYPVVSGKIDNVIGFVSLKSMFVTIDDKDFCLKDIITKAYYLPESMNVNKALEFFKNKRIKSALVTDEFGSVLGIVSLKDIMEAIVGEMLEEDELADIIEREDGTYIVDGRYSFYDFLSYFDREELFDEDINFNTVGGLIIDILQEIPVEGQIIRWHNFIFEVVDMDAARIDKILVKIND
ncbi:MAG: HlyC/CorC family transporter [Bacteroidales bacterium]|nr:HlyC/CorC family transporter [Bacteroidales bacterium]